MAAPEYLAGARHPQTVSPVRRRMLGGGRAVVAMPSESHAATAYEVAEVTVAEDEWTASIFLTVRLPPPPEVRLLLQNTTAHALLVSQNRSSVASAPVLLAPMSALPWAWLDPSAEPTLFVQPVLPSAGSRREEMPSASEPRQEKPGSRLRLAEGVELSTASVGVLPSLKVAGEV